MEDRFITRPDPKGFSVYDLTTGEAVIIGMSAQAGLSREDADHTAQILNLRDRGPVDGAGSAPAL